MLTSNRPPLAVVLTLIRAAVLIFGEGSPVPHRFTPSRVVAQCISVKTDCRKVESPAYGFGLLHTAPSRPRLEYCCLQWRGVGLCESSVWLWLTLFCRSLDQVSRLRNTHLVAFGLLSNFLKPYLFHSTAIHEITSREEELLSLVVSVSKSVECMQV